MFPYKKNAELFKVRHSHLFPQIKIFQKKILQTHAESYPIKQMLQAINGL